MSVFSIYLMFDSSNPFDSNTRIRYKTEDKALRLALIFCPKILAVLAKHLSDTQREERLREIISEVAITSVRVR